jgi:hypothetical protein
MAREREGVGSMKRVPGEHGAGCVHRGGLAYNLARVPLLSNIPLHV